MSSIFFFDYFKIPNFNTFSFNLSVKCRGFIGWNICFLIWYNRLYKCRCFENFNGCLDVGLDEVEIYWGLWRIFRFVAGFLSHTNYWTEWQGFIGLWGKWGEQKPQHSYHVRRPYYNLKRWVGVLRPVIHCFPRANLNILLFKTFLTTSISTLTSSNISTVIRYRWVSFRMQFEYSDLDSDTTRTHHPLTRPTPLHINLRSMCILCRSNWL